MRSIFYIFLGFFWWILDLTIFLPLILVLFFSLSFRSVFFSSIYSTFLESLGKSRLDIARKKAFQILNDNVESTSKPLEVLEIGVAHGPNLKFYPKNCNLTVLDKNKNFEHYFLKNLKEFPEVSCRGFITQPAEDMKGVADESFDVVVSSYLHCSTSDSMAVLREIKRVLKPGGKYLFVDHVGFPKGDIGLLIQKFFNPLWYLHTNGCNLHRDTASKIKAAGFSQVISNEIVFQEVRMYLVRHQIAGVAIK